MHWQTSRFRIDLSAPRVMGVVNATPDSFSDGGQRRTAGEALVHCERLVRAGADLLDIGGESTRPGATPVPLDEELARVLPVVQGALTLGVPVSVDTYKPEVMEAVLALGADIVNDIWALRRPGAREAIARHPACGVCLMHMHGDPRTMQLSPMVGDPLGAVAEFLRSAAQVLQTAGVGVERIVLDAGIGFGKTVDQNFALLAGQETLVALGYPLLTGWSRKSSLGAVTGLDADARMVPSVAAALLAVERGARIVRVHDVAETVAALQVWRKMQAARQPPVTTGGGPGFDGAAFHEPMDQTGLAPPDSR